MTVQLIGGTFNCCLLGKYMFKAARSYLVREVNNTDVTFDNTRAFMNTKILPDRLAEEVIPESLAKTAGGRSNVAFFSLRNLRAFLKQITLIAPYIKQNISAFSIIHSAGKLLGPKLSLVAVIKCSCAQENQRIVN